VEGCGDRRQVIAMRLTAPFQHGVEVASFVLKVIGRPV
jgi:hypothetical protein